MAIASSTEPLGPAATLAQAAALYERLAEVPTIAKAEYIGQEEGTVLLSLSYKDHTTMTTSQKIMHIPIDQVPARESYEVVPVSVDSTVKLDFPVDQPSGYSRVRLREQSVEEKKRRIVEVWIKACRVYSVDVTDAHNEFSTDETFSSSSAIDNSGRLSILYTAAVMADKSSEDPLTRFKYQPPMGEKFAKDFQPGLFLLRVGGGIPADLTRITSSVSGRLLAQGCFAGRDCVGVTAYDPICGGRRLGQVYCTNRPSSVQVFRVSQEEIKSQEPNSYRETIKTARDMDVETACETTILSMRGRSARSPRGLPFDALDGQAWGLIWLETPTGGAHNSSAAIMKATGKEGNYAVKEIVPLDSQQQPSKSGSGGSSGQYLNQLPKQPFLKIDGDWQFGFSSIFRVRGGIRIHRLADGAKTYVSDESEHQAFLAGSTKRPGEFLSIVSTPQQPPSLVLSVAHAETQLLSVYKPIWKCQTSFTSIKTHILQVPSSRQREADEREERNTVGRGQEEEKGQSYQAEEKGKGKESKPIALEEDEEDDLSSTIDAILVTTSERGSTPGPCILFPHGGPHGASTTEWNPGVAALALMGYTVILPNYHGSTGRSPSFVNSLLGKCGRLDIDDCTSTIRHAILKGWAREEDVYYQGGSHGGFIGCHVAGRSDVKDLWKAIALRNPVTHIGEMWATTDIRDWDLAELNLPYPFDNPPPFLSPENFKTLSDASPARMVDEVVAPVLMLLGDSDQRVPPSQGLSYYHGLRSRIERQTDEERKQSRLKSECLWFKGADHALDTVESSRGAWLATWKWFEEARLGREIR